MSRSVVENGPTAETPGGRSQNARESSGRWIRPTRSITPDPPFEEPARAGQALLQEARKRVAALAELERSLDERIRARWRQVEEDSEQQALDLEREIESRRASAEAEFRRERARARKRGNAAGYEKGFGQGRAEGYRAGLAEGRRHGRVEGIEEGRRDATLRLELELGSAVNAFGSAAAELRSQQDALLEEARAGVVRLAVEIARKLVKRELSGSDDVVLRNIEHAIELVLRRGKVTILVHEKDVPIVKEALQESPSWADGFDEIEICAAGDIERGGCRLESRAGTVDMTMQTQIELIEEALGLREVDRDERSGADSEFVTEPHEETEESAE